MLGVLVLIVVDRLVECSTLGRLAPAGLVLPLTALVVVDGCAGDGSADVQTEIVCRSTELARLGAAWGGAVRFWNGTAVGVDGGCETSSSSGQTGSGEASVVRSVQAGLDSGARVDELVLQCTTLSGATPARLVFPSGRGRGVVGNVQGLKSGTFVKRQGPSASTELSAIPTARRGAVRIRDLTTGDGSVGRPAFTSVLETDILVSGSGSGSETSVNLARRVGELDRKGPLGAVERLSPARLVVVNVVTAGVGSQRSRCRRRGRRSSGGAGGADAVASDA